MNGKQIVICTAQFTLIIKMKKIFVAFVLSLLSITAVGQGTFQYCTMKDNIWGEWKESIAYPYFSGYVVNSVGEGDYVIYNTFDHPSNYIFRVKINGFYVDKDKKSRKEHVKNNKWYEFTGIVEIFTDSDTFVSQFPHVPTKDKPELKSNSLPARIIVEPYKKHPKVLNIFFDGKGLGLEGK